MAVLVCVSTVTGTPAGHSNVELIYDLSDYPLGLQTAEALFAAKRASAVEKGWTVTDGPGPKRFRAVKVWPDGVRKERIFTLR